MHVSVVYSMAVLVTVCAGCAVLWYSLLGFGHLNIRGHVTSTRRTLMCLSVPGDALIVSCSSLIGFPLANVEGVSIY
jgi:hypothetical protein